MSMFDQLQEEVLGELNHAEGFWQVYQGAYERLPKDRPPTLVEMEDFRRAMLPGLEDSEELYGRIEAFVQDQLSPGDIFQLKDLLNWAEDYEEEVLSDILHKYPDPEDLYTSKDLEAWAEDNGFKRED